MSGEKRFLPSPFLHPVFVTAFLVMLVNDLFLRPSGMFPVVTGKISDFAVLIFLPAVGSLFILYVKYLSGRLISSVRKTAPATVAFTLFDLLCPVVLTGLVFIGIKAVPFVNALYVEWLNSVNVLKAFIPHLRCVADPTDLIALPCLAVPFLVLRKWVGKPVVKEED
jgi:hypothetical protein